MTDDDRKRALRAVNDDLDAPCCFCGYNGARYFQSRTHAVSCPWYSIGGARERHEALRPMLAGLLARALASANDSAARKELGGSDGAKGAARPLTPPMPSSPALPVAEHPGWRLFGWAVGDKLLHGSQQWRLALSAPSVNPETHPLGQEIVPVFCRTGAPVAQPAPAVARPSDERAECEQVYVEWSQDLGGQPIGSREWSIFYAGWRACNRAAPTATPTAAGWQFSVEQQGNRVALIVRGPKGQGASLDVDDSSVRAEVLRQFAADLAAAPKGAR